MRPTVLSSHQANSCCHGDLQYTRASDVESKMASSFMLTLKKVAHDHWISKNASFISQNYKFNVLATNKI